jgi:hypothetical protein
VFVNRVDGDNLAHDEKMTEQVRVAVTIKDRLFKKGNLDSKGTGTRCSPSDNIDDSTSRFPLATDARDGELRTHSTIFVFYESCNKSNIYSDQSKKSMVSSVVWIGLTTTICCISGPSLVMAQ